jgi:hypothetical protein
MLAKHCIASDVGGGVVSDVAVASPGPRTSLLQTNSPVRAHGSTAIRTWHLMKNLCVIS